MQNMPKPGADKQGGECRVYNREVMAQIISQADEPSEELSGFREPTFRSPKTSPDRKRRDALNKVHTQRDKDQQHIRATVERNKETRERRFERLMGAVMGDDTYLKGKVSNMLYVDQLAYHKKHSTAYNEWNKDVYGKIQKETDAILNPGDRGFSQSLSGSKSVDFKLPDQPSVVSAIEKRVDPSSRLLHDHAAEMTLKRKMDRYVPEGLDPNSVRGLDPAYVDQLDPETLGVGLAGEQVPHPLAARSRPVLEPQMWGQLEIQGTPYGHFAQACEAGKNCRTSVKKGNFVPAETDGVAAAGKRKTRAEGHNSVGILRGQVAARGESHLFKSQLGSSSGAPNQDHFTYEHGLPVVDKEFPLGKMMLYHKH